MPNDKFLPCKHKNIHTEKYKILKDSCIEELFKLVEGQPFLLRGNLTFCPVNGYDHFIRSFCADCGLKIKEVEVKA